MKNPIKDEKDSDSYRVCRGGNWGSYPGIVRASVRSLFAPSNQRYYLGFRLVKNVPKRRNEESNRR